jgi:putative heme-binding domain-containing protein
VAAAATHPDSNVRVLFDRFIPEDQRPKTLGSAVTPDEILALTGDAGRGERIFFQSSAAQCKNCHRVQGVGGTLGPDLSQIGKKYEIRTLLETILDPSKAIAPEYIPHLLETEGGQIFAGFLLEKTDEQVVLRDAKDLLVRVPSDEVAALEPQKKSLMPDLVLRDVTAQDAADMLAYLAGLQSAVAHADRFRVLGPFDSGDRQGIARDYGPEGSLDKIDLAAEYPGLDGQTNRWELVAAADAGGYPAIDQVQYCQERGLRTDRVTQYYLVYADSPADQAATLLVGSDDSCRVWLNGEAIHDYQGSRALGYAQDRVPARLRAGRNVVVLKVENYNGPGGVALSIEAPSGVQLGTN